MMIPIRSFSSGRPIAHKWEEFVARVEKGEDRKKVLDDLGVKSYDDRAIFLGHVDLIDTASQFKKC